LFGHRFPPTDVTGIQVHLHLFPIQKEFSIGTHTCISHVLAGTCFDRGIVVVVMAGCCKLQALSFGIMSSGFREDASSV
jgi:hypothetical protein